MLKISRTLKISKAKVSEEFGKMTATLTRIDNSSSDIILTVALEINSSSFYSKSSYTISKRISEFESLYNYLSNACINSIICPPPFASSDSNFLKNSVSKFLESIIENSVLFVNPVVIDFITSQFAFLAPKSPKLPRKSTGLFSFNDKIQDVDTFYEQVWDKISFLLSKLESIGLCLSKIVQNGTMLSDLKTFCAQLDPVLELLEISKLKSVFTALQFEEFKRLEYQSGVLNDELIYIVRWLNGVKKSLSYRHYLLEKYEVACLKTSKKLTKLEKLKASSSIGSNSVDVVLEEFTVIKQEEGIARSEFRLISEELKPLVVYHMNEIELELIGIWGRWANFQRENSGLGRIKTLHS